MGKDKKYVHQRYFRYFYYSAMKRFEEYRKVLGEKEPQKSEKLKTMIEEEKRILDKFIQQEKETRRKLKKHLDEQQRDVVGWPNKLRYHYTSRKSFLNRFDNLIKLSVDVRRIIEKSGEEGKSYAELLNDIDLEFKAIMKLNNNYEIKKYGRTLLVFAKETRCLFSFS